MYLRFSTLPKFSPYTDQPTKQNKPCRPACMLCSFSQLIFDELVDFFEAGRLFSMFIVVVYQIQKRNFFDGSFAFSLHLRIVHQPNKPYFYQRSPKNEKQQLCIRIIHIFHIPNNPLDNGMYSGREIDVMLNGDVKALF